jgi:hypothetical protein
MSTIQEAALRVAMGENVAPEEMATIAAPSDRNVSDIILLSNAIKRRALGRRAALPPNVERRLAEIDRETEAAAAVLKAAVEVLDAAEIEHARVVRPLYEESQRLLAECGAADSN